MGLLEWQAELKMLVRECGFRKENIGAELITLVSCPNATHPLPCIYSTGWPKIIYMTFVSVSWTSDGTIMVRISSYLFM